MFFVEFDDVKCVQLKGHEAGVNCLDVSGHALLSDTIFAPDRKKKMFSKQKNKVCFSNFVCCMFYQMKKSPDCATVVMMGLA